MAALVGYGIVAMAALGYGGLWLWRAVTLRSYKWAAFALTADVGLEMRMGTNPMVTERPLVTMGDFTFTSAVH